MKRALILLALWLGISAAQADTRVALVIGNGQYASAGRLDNPVRDAAAVAKALREVGFTSVQVEQNLTRESLIQALRRFEQKVDTADWALVYYAGHGIEMSGTNYLVPVDAKLKSDRDVSEEAVSLDQLLARLEGARKLRLVILDACRDNPFLASMKLTIASRSSGTRGLSRIEPDVGTLVAFAAKAGQLAKDSGQNQTNSPYAAALIKNLATPDLEVDFFFRQVRADVLKATGREQDPATYGQLPAERFIFRPAPPQPVQSAPAPPAAAVSPAAPLPPAPAQPATQMAALPPVVTTPVVTLPPAVSPHRQELIDACDRLAGLLGDPDLPAGTSGVAFQNIDAGAAIPACRAAVDVVQAKPPSSWLARLSTTGAEPAAIEEPRMRFQLGRALDAGKQYGDAKAQYEQAAALGSVAAMINLGILYEAGQGVAENRAAARSWNEKAAAKGDPRAMIYLGNLYANGQGVARDYAVARSWYEKAAGKGLANAMYNLGDLYHRGQGVKQDRAVARLWYEKAAAAGDIDAQALLAELSAKERSAARAANKSRIKR